LEVDSFARLVDPPHAQLTREDVDFVLSLHFETPKRYDIFSFVALWNPVQFFHEWGYRRCTRNLLTHDDFISCSSPWADDQVRRLLANDPMRDGPKLKLYHSLSEPIFPPTTGDGMLFYAGINWERLGKKPQRHGELLKLLDKTGDMRIYGPRRFNGVDVWAGFESYQGPVPFDGISIIRAINKAGVSLVLSSEAHRQSELMSSRLFESLAAGAVIISDDNPFACRFFGKTLLYIDSTLDTEATYAQVKFHLDWIRSNPAEARELAKQAQEIFLKDFALDHCLQRIYADFPARKQQLEGLYSPKRAEEKVSLVFLMPEFHPDVLERHIASYLAQKEIAMRPILAMDNRDFALFGQRVQSRLDQLSAPIAVEALDFFERYPGGAIRSRRRTGRVIQQAIEQLIRDDYFCVVSAHERLFSDHLRSLLRTLQDHEDAGSAWADVLLFHTAEGVDYADLNDAPASNYLSNDMRVGCGRFLFRKSAIPPDVDTALPYLDALPLALLFGITGSLPSKRCTLAMDVEDRLYLETVKSARREEEREILVDYAPSVFGERRSFADYGQPGAPSPESMTPEQKTKLAVDLAHSVPLPALMKKIGFGLYRLWLGKSNARS
jgi:hypothetical protein